MRYFVFLALCCCSPLTPRSPTPVEPHYEVFGLRWSKPIVAQGFDKHVIASFGQPAISQRHQSVIVGTGEGYVVALRLKDGQVLWKKHYGAPFETAATLVTRKDGNEAVLVSQRNGTLLLLNISNGEIYWSVPIIGEMRVPAVIEKQRAYIATSGNRLFVVDIDTGTIALSLGRSLPATLSITGHGAPLLADNKIVVGCSDGTLSAYDKENGQLLWAKALSARDAAFIDIDTTPVILQQTIFVASYSDGIYALDIKNGNILWQRPFGSITSLAAFDDRLFAASSDGYILGIQQSTGELLFKTKLMAAPMSQLYVRQNYLIVTAGDLGLVVLDAHTGKPLQTTPVLGRAESSLSLSQRDLVFVSSAGILYTFYHF